MPKECRLSELRSSAEPAYGPLGLAGRLFPRGSIILRSTKETYIRMFELLKKYFESLSLRFYPRKFHIDFEAAALKAILEVFPAYEVKWCLIHFYQAAVWGRVHLLARCQHLCIAVG